MDFRFRHTLQISKKRLLKFFFKGNFSAHGTNFRGATKLSWLVLTHHFSPVQNIFFEQFENLTQNPVYWEFLKYWNLKNPLAKKLFKPGILKRFFRNFGTSNIFIKINFLICKAIFGSWKKIRLDKYFGIWAWKCAPVGKIKSFTVTNGLRISNFRTFYFIKF